MADSRLRSSDRKVTWDMKGRTPFSSSASDFGSATSVGDKAYFKPDRNSEYVYEYVSTTGEWQKLPMCLVWGCALVNIRGKLTTVGGQYDRPGGIDYLCWDDVSRCWEPETRYPQMPEYFISPVVATTADHLIAASTIAHVGRVWVMDLNTLQWLTVANLPRSPRSIAVCNGRVYVAFEDSSVIRHCSLDALLQSTRQQNVWQVTEYPDTPFSFPALVTVNQRLLCKVQNTIMMYEEEEKTFVPVKSMPVRFDKLVPLMVCALPGGRVLCTDPGMILMGKLHLSAGI